jgi:hypothetical protein
MGGACGKCEGKNRFPRVFFYGELQVMRQFGRPRNRLENNIKTGVKEIGLVNVDCSHLVQDREVWRDVVSTVMNHMVPYNANNFFD